MHVALSRSREAAAGVSLGTLSHSFEPQIQATDSSHSSLSGHVAVAFTRSPEIPAEGRSTETKSSSYRRTSRLQPDNRHGTLSHQFVPPRAHGQVVAASVPPIAVSERHSSSSLPPKIVEYNNRGRNAFTTSLEALRPHCSFQTWPPLPKWLPRRQLISLQPTKLNTAAGRRSQRPTAPPSAFEIPNIDTSLLHTR